MTPYYQDEQITLYNGDARDIIGKFKVDVIVTDPPYNQTSLRWDRWPHGWPSLAKDALLPHGSMWVFGSMRMFFDRLSEFAGWKMAQDIVWEKHNGSNFHADRFRRVHENIVQFYLGNWGDVYKCPVTTDDETPQAQRHKKRPPHMGGDESETYLAFDGKARLMRSVQYVRSTHGYAVHPTQKPLPIIMPLLRYSCPEQGIVFDPFAGSCSTLLAAKELGLRAIGVEINERFCEKAITQLTTPLESFRE